METEKQTQVSLVNGIGCKINACLSDLEIREFEKQGWKIDKEEKTKAFNLALFGV
jgi:hypothetical protein